jgi:AcrR family transcriptional regulator
MTRGRPREFDRDKALQAAMLVFWRKGFLATSMTDLCEAMDIRSPSLYAAFGSKENLYVEAVQHYANTFETLLWKCLNGGSTARESIEATLLQAARGLRKSAKCPGGCMVTLAILDEDMPAPIPSVLRKARREHLERLRARLQTGLSAGELPASTDVNSLSRFYLGIVQAIAIQSRDGAPLVELERMVETAMTAWPRG